MSRIGKKPILIPVNVEVKIEDSKITAKGPKGELSKEISPEFKIEIKEGKIFVLPKKEIKSGGRKAKKIKSMWGFTGALLTNLLKGVVEGYEKKLEVEGLGYKVLLEGPDLVLQVGFTHPVKIKVPEGIKFSVEKNIIIVSGIDKAVVGQVAAKIREVRPPEPYKGKGIRYSGEVVRRKAGKKVVTTAPA